MFKVDLKKIILGMDKQPIKDKEGIVLDIKGALLLSLIQPSRDSNGTSWEEAVKARRLFDKIDSADSEVELKADEIMKLKKVVSEKLSEVIAGSVCLALEPDERV